jgi:RNA polymerase sigma-70 factor (ECF subfamily)
VVHNALTSSSFRLPPLPNSGDEVESISRVFPVERRRIYLGPDATEEALKNRPLNRCRVIHLATHSLIDERAPARSGVVLTLDDDPGEDGFLAVNEIASLDLNADLVVLSACQERYARPLRLWAKRRTGDPSLVEDVCQETFRIAIEKLRQGELRNPESLAEFILGIARNKASQFDQQAERFVNEDPDALAAIPDPAPSQLDEMLQRDEAALVQQVISELPLARDREVIIRFYLEEEDKDRICADLNLTRAQFTLVLHRARERFEQLYKKWVGKQR